MNAERERLLRLCLKGLEAKGLTKDERYKNRLKREVKEIDAQGEHEYLLGLYDRFRVEKLIFPANEHNLLVDYLLNLANEFDIDREYGWIQGESPDIDVDYIREIRDKLKRVWAPHKFGQSRICEIGLYGTLGIKSSMLDTAKVYSLPREEIQSITNKMADKDDEGHELEWDKALEIYPEFKAYCERNPQVAADAKLALDRNKSGGVHAGGLIISDRDLDGFLPLEVRMVNKENPGGVICSAWTEGLNRQDLQPVGLIKFDLLVINNLLQIALACDLVKRRHGVEKISALPGQWDWSDISYLNDPKALAMANAGDLKCIFQFDSEGIRRMVKRGGVTSFDDLAAYSALYRPGPLGMGMDARYCDRKKGREPFNIHPVMKPILEKTYGVMVYQEQVMEILRLVGLIPDMHTEKVRKAISKKKVDQFIKYKKMFIENGMRVLNVNAQYVMNLWDQIESFAEYGFNKSHSYAYTYISARLLWLKAHYPLEFYTAILMCETDDKKFKDYKLDAKYHGINVKPVHINKSKANFAIDGSDIYFGFSNIKKLGEAMADRIVAGQPYQSFADFLDRFGTDATAVKALVALGVFDEPHDRVTLRKFSEWFKKQSSSRRDRKKRHEVSLEKKTVDLKDLLLEEVQENDPDFEAMCQFTPEAEALWQLKLDGITRSEVYKYKGEQRMRDVPFIKKLQDLAKKRQQSIESFQEKEKADEEVPIRFEQFDPESIKLEPEEEEILKDEMEVNGDKCYPKAESMYYGFQWTHLLETSLDYTGATLDKFLAESSTPNEDGQIVETGYVEVQINKVRTRTSKPKKKGQKPVTFYSVDIEDANGKQMTVNVWQDDYTLFQEELKPGSLVSMQVNPPGGGFNTLTFKSVPRHKRRYLPPKKDDARLVPLRVPERVEPKKQEAVLDDLKFDSVILETEKPVEPLPDLDPWQQAVPEAIKQEDYEFLDGIQ